MTLRKIEEVRKAIAVLSALTEEEWKDLYFFNKHSDAQSIPIGEDVCSYLKKLGIPSSLKGYKYLETAINMAISNPRSCEQITKVLYPSIAKQHYTSATKVERCIRHAVEIAFSKGDIDLIEEIFGNTISSERGKATNSQFIITIAEYIKHN